ncbi:MAG TPA: hypothetical protein VG892_07715 [Terriglobales bacterium]|nr:hypothetical protein [Terriglobales bacterium]
MSLTEKQRIAALELRHKKVPHIQIAQDLGIPRQDLIRFFMAIDHSINRKLRPGDTGIYDLRAEEVMQEEHAKAEEMWRRRMGGAKWNRARRDGDG